MQAKYRNMTIICAFALGASGLKAEGECYDNFPPDRTLTESFPTSLVRFGDLECNGPFSVRVDGGAMQDPETQICTLHTELVSMNMTCSDGSVISLREGTHSEGGIVQLTRLVDFPARSFFRVLAKSCRGSNCVDLPDITVENPRLDSIPPGRGSQYTHEDKLALHQVTHDPDCIEDCFGNTCVLKCIGDKNITRKKPLRSLPSK